MDPTEREWQARARLSLHFAARVLGGEANLTAGYQQLVMSAFIPFFGPPDEVAQVAFLAIADPERWERIADRIVTDDATGWDDLAATP